MTKFTIVPAFQGFQALKPSGYSRQQFNHQALSQRMVRLTLRNNGSRTAALDSSPQHLDARLLEDGHALEAAWGRELNAMIAWKRSPTDESQAAVKAARTASAQIVARIETARALTLDGLKVQARAVLWRRDGEPLGPEMPDEHARDEAWTEMADLPNW